MGLFDWGKRKLEKKVDNKKTLASPVLVFKGKQEKGFKGFKKVLMVTYNEEDTTNYDNASKLYEKYGKEFVGAEITIEKINYDISITGERNPVLSVKVDDLPVGVIFDTSEHYDTIVDYKIEKAYCRAEEETIIGKKKTVTRLKTALLVKII